MYNYVLIQRLSFLSFSTRSLTCTLFVLLFILVDNSGLFAQNTNKDSADKGLWGYIDKTGKTVIPCQWHSAKPFSEGLAAVEDEYFTGGFIDKTGKLIITMTLPQSFSEGLAGDNFHVDSIGFVDKTGNVVIKGPWNFSQPFSEGLAAILEKDKWGFIDKTGKLVIPCRWDGGFMRFQEGLARVENRKFGFIDKTGNLVIPCKWKFAWPFNEGLAAVENNHKKFGFIDKSGKVVIQFKWKDAGPFFEGLARVMNSDDKWGFIDKKGNLLIPCQWKRVYNFCEGLAAVKNDNNRWGFVDIFGKIVIPCHWKDVRHGFSEGLVGVMDENGYWGFIDKTGKKMTPFQWKDVEKFSEGLAMVKGSNTLVDIKDEFKDNKTDSQLPQNTLLLMDDKTILGQQPDLLKEIMEIESPQPQIVVQVNSQEEKKNVAKQKETRIALVIGNANYASQRLESLSSPINDARGVSKMLEKLGFKVRPVVENGSKNTMRKAIMDFIREAKNYDVALFYYSGHGIQSKPGLSATNYLIPSDAKLQFCESLSGECIDLNEMVLNNLSKEREGKASLAFIDACRTVLNLPSESDFGETKGSDRELRGLNEHASPEGVCVVYATRAGNVSYDMRQKKEIIGQNNLNSYFTQGLLECLDEYKGMDLPVFIQFLKEKVRTKTHGRQIPSPYNELYGVFYFDPTK